MTKGKTGRRIMAGAESNRLRPLLSMVVLLAVAQLGLSYYGERTVRRAFLPCPLVLAGLAVCVFVGHWRLDYETVSPPESPVRRPGAVLRLAGWR